MAQPPLQKTYLRLLVCLLGQELRVPKEKADATLWECNEYALRYILEDGKLNLYELRARVLVAAPPAAAAAAAAAAAQSVSARGEPRARANRLRRCLRLLDEHRTFMAGVQSGARVLSATDAEKLDKCEQSLSILLRNAWKHVEALQVRTPCSKIVFVCL